MHLLGSIHVMDSTPVLSRQAEKAYSRTKRVAFESNLDVKPDPSSFCLAGDNHLNERIPPPLFSALRERWVEAELSESKPDLLRLQPWFAALRLQGTVAARRGITHEQGIDRHIWNRAAGDDVEIVELEPPSASLQAFASAPLDEQIRFLAHVAVDTRASQAELDSMICAWRAGRKRWFGQFLKQRSRPIPTTFRALITQRNQAWIPRLTAMVGDGVPTLVVVGALHCVGTAGLPALLNGRRLVARRVR